MSKPDLPPDATWRDLLMSTPPSSPRVVGDALVADPQIPPIVVPGRGMHIGGGSGQIVATPILALFCDSEPCQREQHFECNTRREGNELFGAGVTLLYVCKNCGSGFKQLAVAATRIEGQPKRLRAVKLGEWPPYGPRKIPADLDAILPSPSVELYYSGLTCEGLGLGIGAAAYYRRIVEDAKDALLARIDDCLATLEPAADYRELRESIVAARKQTQFSSAVEALKGTLPPFLVRDGRNLLALLHAGLSDDLHNQADEQILADAHNARLVLEEIARRIASALARPAEFDAAVRALASKAARPSSQGQPPA